MKNGQELLKLLESAKLLVSILNSKIERIHREMEVSFRLSQSMTEGNLTALRNSVIDAAIRGEGRRTIENIFHAWERSVGLDASTSEPGNSKFPTIGNLKTPETNRMNGKPALQATNGNNDWLRVI